MNARILGKNMYGSLARDFLQNIGLRQSIKLKVTQISTASGKTLKPFVNYEHW